MVLIYGVIVDFVGLSDGMSDEIENGREKEVVRDLRLSCLYGIVIGGNT